MSNNNYPWWEDEDDWYPEDHHWFDPLKPLIMPAILVALVGFIFFW